MRRTKKERKKGENKEKEMKKEEDEKRRKEMEGCIMSEGEQASHVFFSCLIHARIFSPVTSSSTSMMSTSSSGSTTNMAVPSAIGSFSTPAFSERSYAKKYLSARNIMGTMTTWYLLT